MTSAEVTKDTTPAFMGGDLPSDERVALREDHDADLAPQGRSTNSDTNDGAAHKDASLVHEKHVPQDVASDPSEETGSTHHDDLEKGGKKEQATETVVEEQDPNIVFWDGPDDPQNPVNWSATKKWGNVAILSALTLLTPLASSMFAPGVPEVMRNFHQTSPLLATFVVSVYILGYAIGPLILAPLSEMYGRVPVYNVCNVIYTIFTVACALSTNMNMLIGFRFLSGAFGIAPITNGGGTIADIMRPEQRGAAMSIWAIGPLLGPVIGPVAGGFLAQAEGWRWIFWVIAIALGVTTILCFALARETYAPVLLARKTKRLQKETGNMNLRSKLDLGISMSQLWRRSLTRPLKLMFLSPICALMSLYMAVVYGILYLLFTTFTFVFEDDYGFSQSIVGLVYIGLGVGMLLGLAFLGATSDRLSKHMAAKHNGGKLKPEYRLPMLMWLGPLIPAGLFLYGWTAQHTIQWAVPLLGTAFVGVGLIAAFMCINTYLIDAYTLYAASALAANTVFRSILGACFPLFGLQMYNVLGLGWGNSLLGFLALALCPIPWLFFLYGEKIRLHPKLQIKL